MLIDTYVMIIECRQGIKSCTLTQGCNWQIPRLVGRCRSGRWPRERNHLHQLLMLKKMQVLSILENFVGKRHYLIRTMLNGKARQGYGNEVRSVTSCYQLEKTQRCTKTVLEEVYFFGPATPRHQCIVRFLRSQHVDPSHHQKPAGKMLHVIESCAPRVCAPIPSSNATHHSSSVLENSYQGIVPGLLLLFLARTADH